MAFETNNAGNLRRSGKSPTAFRTISEVSEGLEVPPHVLRFWETKFSQIKPLKRGGGRRYYRPEDVSLLRKIRELLYSDGYTIKGVQRLLKDEIPKNVTNLSKQKVVMEGKQELSKPTDTPETDAKELQVILDDLIKLKNRLSEIN